MLRSECKDAPRPCPYVSCRHHLYLDVNPMNGNIKVNFPTLEVTDLLETCSLDVADRQGAMLEEVGDYLNLTRERVRQLEDKASRRLRRVLEKSGVHHAQELLLDNGPVGREAE